MMGKSNNNCKSIFFQVEMSANIRKKQIGKKGGED